MAYRISLREITVQEKLHEIERELNQRRRVYARLVEQRKLRQDVADRQIAIMEAIRTDYVALAAKERLL